jgi:hypothetical protein
MRRGSDSLAAELGSIGLKHERTDRGFGGSMRFRCIRALETDGYVHALIYYVDHNTLRSFNVHDIAVFTGKLNTAAITRQEQWYLASNYDGKMTVGNIEHDFRDWEAIAAWANSTAKELWLHPVFVQPESRDVAQV